MIDHVRAFQQSFQQDCDQQNDQEGWQDHGDGCKDRTSQSCLGASYVGGEIRRRR